MIRYIALCKVIETGSFTRAAEELGYTQAAVSQMVRSLENELSVTILRRTKQGVFLTPEGEELYPSIQKHILSHRELADKAASINGIESGEIRIGTFSSISQKLLPGLIKSFSDQYPKVEFVLRQGNNTTLPEWIRSGLIDFGFVYPEAAAGLVCRPLLTDRYLAVLPENHPLAGQRVSLKMLASEPLILGEEGITNTVVSAFESRHISIKPKYRIFDDHTILSMVENGIGVAILSSMLLDRANYRISKAEIIEPVVRTVGVTYRDRSALPSATTKFIDFMFNAYNKEAN